MTVGSLVLHHHHEGALFRLAILEPIDGQIGDDVGGVTLVPPLVEALLRIGGKAHLRIVIGALADQPFVVVKAGRLRFQMPFAEEGGLVALLL